MAIIKSSIKTDYIISTLLLPLTIDRLYVLYIITKPSTRMLECFSECWWLTLHIDYTSLHSIITKFHYADMCRAVPDKYESRLICMRILN